MNRTLNPYLPVTRSLLVSIPFHMINRHNSESRPIQKSELHLAATSQIALYAQPRSFFARDISREALDNLLQNTSALLTIRVVCSRSVEGRSIDARIQHGELIHVYTGVH